MSISFDQNVAIADDVLVRELDGESVILNVSSGHYFGLDEVGTRMLQALADSISVSEAFEKLSAEYEVEPDRLQADLEELLEKLVENGLVEVRSS